MSKIEFSSDEYRLVPTREFSSRYIQVFKLNKKYDNFLGIFLEEVKDVKKEKNQRT